jgi:hypothetical protein
MVMVALLMLMEIKSKEFGIKDNLCPIKMERATREAKSTRSIGKIKRMETQQLMKSQIENCEKDYLKQEIIQ